MNVLVNASEWLIDNDSLIMSLMQVNVLVNVVNAIEWLIDNDSLIIEVDVDLYI